MQANTFNNVVPVGGDVSEYFLAIVTIIARRIIQIPEIPNATGKQSSLPKHWVSCRRIGLMKRDVILPMLYTK